MTKAEEAAEPEVPEKAGHLKTFLTTLPRWKKVLITAATAMFLMGFVSVGVEAATIETQGEFANPDGSPGALPSTLVPGETRTGQDPENTSRSDTPWSEAFFRYGFSFFVGFAVGFAFRAFLRLALILVGTLALALFLLSHAGFVTVEWQAIDVAFEASMATIKEQISAFRSFITGSLPNAGLAGLGLFTGFRKN